MNKVFIIAEAGVNHNGSIKLAKKLIDVAYECGADAVKFQTFKTENLVTKYAPKANYQKRTTSKIDTHFEMLKKLELNESMHLELIKYCKEKNIFFLSSPFDNESIDLLEKLGLEILKIPSGELTNLFYLKHIVLNKKIILSTGMASINEINKALKILKRYGTKKKNITILHANTDYPTPMVDVNLKAMVSIGNKFKINYGYSDHTPGIEVSIAAVALGAKCIEKHFTLNSKMKGPDHNASIEPNQLKNMIKAIRNVEACLGNGLKKPSKSEICNMGVVRKSIVALKNIRKGEIFSELNLTAKRPGNGMSPFDLDKILGKKVKEISKKISRSSYIEIFLS